MTDESTNIVTAAQPVTEPPVAPAIPSEPVSAEAHNTEVPNSATADVKEAPTLLAEEPAVEPKVEEPKQEPAPVEDKKDTEPKTEDIKEESKQEGQSDEPAPPPVFEAFTFPEGVTPSEETLKEFTDLLSNLETEGKADHAELQKWGQKAVDFYQKEIQKTISDLNTFYQKTWNETKLKWKDSFLNDPEIGGNRANTTLSSALNFLRTHGGTPEQQAEFRQLMDQSGLGNHPTMIRLLANAGRAMQEGKPLAAQAPPKVQKSKTETLYGSRAQYINKG